MFYSVPLGLASHDLQELVGDMLTLPCVPSEHMSPWDWPPMLLTVRNGLAKIPADARVHCCRWGRERAPYEFHVDIQKHECGEQEMEEWLAMMASTDVRIDEFPEGGLAFKKYCSQKYGYFPMKSMICKIYIWFLQYFQYEHVHVYDPEYFTCELNSF